MTSIILPQPTWITRQQAVKENAIERIEESSTTVSSVQLQLLDLIFALGTVDKWEASERDGFPVRFAFKHNNYKRWYSAESARFPPMRHGMDFGLGPYVG